MRNEIGGEKKVKAEDLIGRKISINDLMNLWDEGWGIAVHVDTNDESPYIIEKKSDFFDIGAELFECIHADDDSEDEKFIEVVVSEAGAMNPA
ncbi:MAG: hypothetical protein DRP85_06530 [Candidatus Makaraimicrobium thalassicum]|nr:MAG: hypothetical protein DRP85_06530 [Candidatus Omnitrophota bacterium]